MVITTPTKHMPNSDGDFIATQLADGILRFDGYPGQEFDLADFQEDRPKRLLFTINQSGKISVDMREDYWLIATVDIPAKQFDGIPVLDDKGNSVLDKNGMSATESVLAIIDNIDLISWQLPKEK
jgi:hypothetical protein